MQALFLVWVSWWNSNHTTKHARVCNSILIIHKLRSQHSPALLLALLSFVSNHYLSSKLSLCSTVTIQCVLIEYCDALIFCGKFWPLEVTCIRRAPPINILVTVTSVFVGHSTLGYSTILLHNHHSITHEHTRSGPPCQTVSNNYFLHFIQQSTS